MYCGGRKMHSKWFNPAFIGFGDFGPWGRKRRFFESGEVRLALLSLLGDGAKHGYELMKELESRSGGLYKASAGTIYPTLQQLEDEGLVVSQAHNGKKVYRLTDAGRAELEREEATVRKIWSRADDWSEWSCIGVGIGNDASEVAGPLGGVIRAAFRAAGSGSDRRDAVRQVRDILEKTRDELERLAEH